MVCACAVNLLMRPRCLAICGGSAPLRGVAPVTGGNPVPALMCAKRCRAARTPAAVPSPRSPRRNCPGISLATLREVSAVKMARRAAACRCEWLAALIAYGTHAPNKPHDANIAYRANPLGRAWARNGRSCRASGAVYSQHQRAFRR